MNSLRQMPQKHALDEDSILATPGVRKCHHKNYKIYYIVSPPLNSVIILRVLHMHVDSKSKIYRTFGIRITHLSSPKIPQQHHRTVQLLPAPLREPLQVILQAVHILHQTRAQVEDA